MPAFEYAHLPLQFDGGILVETSAKEKPWKAIAGMRNDPKVEASILGVLTDLTGVESQESVFEEEFEQSLSEKVQEWARKNCPNDPRFGLK